MSIDSTNQANYEIDFRDLDESILRKVIKNMNDCGESIQGLAGALGVFSEIKAVENTEFMVDSINLIIQKIEQSDGFKSFIKLYQIKFIENDGTSRDATLFEIIEGINEMMAPQLPWIIPKGFFLFKKDKEEVLKEQKNIQNFKLENDDIYGVVHFFDSEHDLILREMQTQSNRSQDVFNMYINSIILEKFNSQLPNSEKIKTSIDYLNDGKIIGSNTDPKIDGKSINNYLEELFFMHYDDAKARIKNADLLPKKIDPKNSIWIDFENAGNKLKNSILKFKSEKIQLLRQFKSKDEDNLLRETREFLIKNGLKELPLPTLQELSEKKPGGPGLVKKIGDAGGIKKFQSSYFRWINQKSIEEKERLRQDEEYKEKTEVQILKSNSWGENIKRDN